MKRIPKISESEWAVMKVLWKKSPLTANEIVGILTRKSEWKKETVRTFVNRLVQKKAIGFEKKGREYHYFALVTEKQCVLAETKSFLKKMPAESIEPMLASFVEEESLPPGTIKRLRRILDEAEISMEQKGKKKAR